MKPLEWIASSKKSLKAMPDEVQDNVGYALLLAQLGQKHDETKPLKGLIRGQFRGYSLERLFKFLNAFDLDVEVNVKSKPEDRERS